MAVYAELTFDEVATFFQALDLGQPQSVRVLTPCERSLLPDMQRAGAFRFWLSRLWDMHRPGKPGSSMPTTPTRSNACFAG